MRIAHVVTLMSPDAAYGGPVRVAVNQARALRQAGHEVTIFAGARGYASLPTELDGVPLRLFPVRNVVPRSGFAGNFSRALLASLNNALPALDLVHVHLARDLVTLPAAALARRTGIPYVVQSHGMINESRHLMSAPLDALITRPVLRSAARVFYLTSSERTALAGMLDDSCSLVHLWNGVPLTNKIEYPKVDVPEVLFLARMHKRKRPLQFVEMAVKLAAAGVNARFRLVGPDEGEGAALRQRISQAVATTDIAWEGAIDPEKTLSRMRQAHVYVLPSVNEPFPMAVLEAMSVGLPVVVTDTCGLSRPIQQSNAGRVVDDTLDALTDAVHSVLIERRERERMGRNAAVLVETDFSIDAIADRLALAYREVL